MYAIALPAQQTTLKFFGINTNYFIHSSVAGSLGHFAQFDLSSLGSAVRSEFSRSRLTLSQDTPVLPTSRCEFTLLLS